MTLHPYDPIPWETFTVVTRPNSHSLTLRKYTWICGVVIVGVVAWAGWF